MLNPFRIYKPVRELVEHVKENRSDYRISIDHEGFLSCTDRKNTDWRISLSPMFFVFLWKNDSAQWTTWAEGWYLYKHLGALAVENSPENTRKGWTKKLGLEEDK